LGLGADTPLFSSFFGDCIQIWRAAGKKAAISCISLFCDFDMQIIKQFFTVL